MRMKTPNLRAVCPDLNDPIIESFPHDKYYWSFINPLVGKAIPYHEVYCKKASQIGMVAGQEF